MNTSVNSTAERRGNRGVLAVRILTWSAVGLFFVAFLLIPRGITVFWSMYFLFFGPAIIIDFAAIIGFVICRLMRRKISFAYLVMSLAVLAGVWYVTWFELRLRWYELSS